MKKLIVLAIIAVSVSAFSLGCSSSSSDWCRRGSVWSPFSKPAASASSEYVITSGYMPSACDPCATIDSCNGIGGVGSAVLPEPY